MKCLFKDDWAAEQTEHIMRSNYNLQNTFTVYVQLFLLSPIHNTYVDAHLLTFMADSKHCVFWYSASSQSHLGGKY